MTRAFFKRVRGTCPNGWNLPRLSTKNDIEEVLPKEKLNECWVLAPADLQKHVDWKYKHLER